MIAAVTSFISSIYNSFITPTTTFHTTNTNNSRRRERSESNSACPFLFDKRLPSVSQRGEEQYEHTDGRLWNVYCKPEEKVTLKIT